MDAAPHASPHGSGLPPTATTMPSAKIILVTGATRGIGFNIAQALALVQRTPQDITLVVGRSKASADDAVEQLHRAVPGATFQRVELDVTKDEDIKAAVEFVRAEHGRLDGEALFAIYSTAAN